MNFNMRTPCPHCPFRTDRPGFLRRADEIADALLMGQTFTCHLTTVPTDEDEDADCDMMDGPNAEHCAGALIMLEHMEQPNQLMRIFERFGGYDRTKLDMDAPVFTDAEDFIEHHENEERP